MRRIPKWVGAPGARRAEASTSEQDAHTRKGSDVRARVWLLMLLSSTVGAGQETTCVPLPLIEGLFGWTDQNVLVGVAPPQFADLAIPPGMVVLGGTLREGHETLVLASEGSAESSRRALMTGLQGEGWSEVQAEHSTGFVARRQNTVLCHPDQGSRFLSARSGTAGGSTVRIDAGAGNQPCESPLQRRGHFQDGLRAYMPELEPPEGARYVGGGGGSSGSGGDMGDDAHISARLETELSPVALQQAFNELMEAQGWLYEAEWDAGLSVGSLWLRTVPRGDAGDAPVNLLATLTSTQISEGRVDALLRIVRRAADAP